MHLPKCLLRILLNVHQETAYKSCNIHEPSNSLLNVPLEFQLARVKDVFGYYGYSIVADNERYILIVSKFYWEHLLHLNGIGMLPSAAIIDDVREILLVTRLQQLL